MFRKGGAINDGQFELFGKDEQAYLLVECKDCHIKYRYDSLWGKVKEYDELKEIAKNDFGINL